MGLADRLGLTRITKALIYSLHGLKICFQKEAAFRQEILLCAVLVPLSFFIAASVDEWLLLIGSLILVLIVEVVNSAIERVVDRISPERHALSGEAKDMGSAAVLLSLILCGLCWGAIILF